jgi:hypothetical protein
METQQQHRPAAPRTTNCDKKMGDVEITSKELNETTIDN